jgi:hypothetical protein
MTTNTQYSYGIIKDNNPYFAQESVLLDNKYKKAAKYALIEKIVHKDGSENISRIVYGSDICKLQAMAAGYVSWYNYPLCLTKNIQGYITQL